jgi:hypothetical protein
VKGAPLFLRIGVRSLCVIQIVSLEERLSVANRQKAQIYFSFFLFFYYLCASKLCETIKLIN